jgi:hypothetical protein
MATNADRIEEFFRLRKTTVDVHHLVHALEDIPADAQEQAAQIFSTPVGITYRQRVFDILENAIADAYGHLECERLFTFLSQYPVTTYTYDISPLLSRGDRPDGSKIAKLYDQGYSATINLCAETPLGDTLYIAQAKRIGMMETYHIPVLDASPPTQDQVLGLLSHLDQLSRRGVRTYIHCEAGKGRTGVMVACVRMATMGWSVIHAVAEAKHFGLWTPVQEAFIVDFGALLVANFDARANDQELLYPALNSYPVTRPGSATPAPEELTMTLELTAQVPLPVSGLPKPHE